MAIKYSANAFHTWCALISCQDLAIDLWWMKWEKQKAVCGVPVSKPLLWVCLTSMSHFEVLFLAKEKRFCFVSITNSTKPFTFKVWNLTYKIKLLQATSIRKGVSFFLSPFFPFPPPPTQCELFQGILVIDLRYVMCLPEVISRV